MAETWYQHAGNAQRTGSCDVTPTLPWRLLWADGPDTLGQASTWRGSVPAECYPICGADTLLMSRGGEGLICYDLSSGDVLWKSGDTFPLIQKTFVASGAYNATTDCFIVGATNGEVQKIKARTGVVESGYYPTTAPIVKAPAINGQYAYITCEDGSLYKLAIGALDTDAMSLTWRYAGGASAGKRAETPPTVSADAGKIVYATADGYVHAVVDATGAASWRVKPHSHAWGYPYTFEPGWPVIAEDHGVVFLRNQVVTTDIDDGPNGGAGYPNDDADGAGGTIRTWLAANTDKKTLLALNLTDGAEAFVPAVGFTAMEGTYLGDQAVRAFPPPPCVSVQGGDEVAYIQFRNHSNGTPDNRWEGNAGEMVLDGATVSGLAAGDLRFIQAGGLFSGRTGYVFPIDEGSVHTMLGSWLCYHGFWGMEPNQIANRGDTKGLTFADPITTTERPAVVRAKASAGTRNNASHYCADSGSVIDGRNYNAPAFWAYWGIYDPPRVPSNLAGSTGPTPRYGFTHKQYVVVCGNGGELLVFRHSGTGTFDAVPTPTALVLEGPASGNVSTASDPFTVKLSPAESMLGASVVVTPSDGAAGGSFTPATVTLDANNSAATFVYTPAVGDSGTTVTITLSNNGGLGNP